MTLYTAEPFAVVCYWDPAVDDEASDIGGYIETRELSLLKFHPGMKPTKYMVGRLDVDDAIALLATEATEEGKCHIAFRAAMMSAENVRWRDGATVEPSFVPKCHGSMATKGRKLISKQEMAARFGPTSVFEIGAVIVQRSFLEQGMPLTFVAPDSSAAAWARKVVASRRVASKTPGTSASAPAPADSSTETCAPKDGASPGAATVAEP